MKLVSQRGSTLIGIIIGLVIGLALAVVVALVITKGSSPFVNKVKDNKGSDASTGQISDPNKPMYGNASAAKEAAKEFAPEPSASAAATTAVVPPGPTPAVIPAPAPASNKPETKPPEDKLDKLIDKAIAKTDTAAEDKWVYFLQAGAFKEQSDAENTRAKLALLGFEASLSERSTDNGVLYRVRVGPYNQIEAMNKVRAKLIENGIDVSIVHNQR